MKRQRGQAIVEFAFVTPLLFLLVVGCLDFGRAVADFVTLSHVTFEGARLAGLMAPATGAYGSDPNDQAATSAVIGMVESQGGILDPVSLSEVVVTDAACPAAIDATRECRTVQVTKVFQPMTPIVRDMTGSFNMQKTVMTVVQN